MPTLEDSASVELPSGTQPGEVLTLRGRACPRSAAPGAGNLRVVVNVVIPRRLNDEQRELLEQLSGTLTEENLRSGGVDVREAAARAGQPGCVIRLAVRVRRAQAELVLAELLELAPAGVEESQVGEETVEYAVYGAPGELPSLPDLTAAAGDALVEISTSETADDWQERWKRFHRPVLIEAPPPRPGDAARRVPAVHVRPPWEAASDGLQGRSRRS